MTSHRAPADREGPRSERNAAVLGISLGVAFGTCFLTGLVSHFIQHPTSWFQWTPRPAGLYRLTQGLHVATGIAAIPLLAAKLWTVYPKLFRRPPFEDLTHALERLSLFPLVAGAVFLLVSGMQNIFHWYPWKFFFPTYHYAAAWITIGAMVIHIVAKATQARAILSRAPARDCETTDGLSRRAVLRLAFGGAGLLTLATVGQTLGPLLRFDLLAPRRPDIGPQGFPVNKTATEAEVVAAANDPGYRLVVEGGSHGAISLSLGDLEALAQHQATLPVACVEGWSANVAWQGVRVRDLVALAGGPAPGGSARVTVHSLEPNGLYARSTLNAAQADDPDTLLALRANGSPLHLDHGYPLRLVGPNRPGVQQTKWVTRVVIA